MGADSKRGAPPLPAPTETDTNTPTEMTSDVSKLADEKSSYSIPDDGTPVTIRTRGHRSDKSQTSLLIEYFEGGSPGDSASGSRASRKPSIRVRLTPSKRGKGDHFQVTEGSSSRKASVSRRIALDDGGPSTRQIELPDPGEDSNSLASYASATEESNVSRNPIDIEIDQGRRRRRPASPLIPPESYAGINPSGSYAGVNASDISAIPADSFLDGTGPSGTDTRRASSPSAHGSSLTGPGTALTAAPSDQVRSGKRRERVKIADRPKERPERTRRSKSRASSSSEQPVDEHRPSSRHQRSSRGVAESAVSAGDSAVSANAGQSHRSFDAHSMRPSASNPPSINNPKLLETVEDAIRRLILPELSALKRESSRRETRRGSMTSVGTSLSREEAATPDQRRRSSGRSSSARPSSSGRRRNREARHDYGDSSPHTISRESIHDDYRYGDGDDDDPDATTPKRADDLLKAATSSATSRALSSVDDESLLSEDRRQRDRRRRRADGTRSRSLGRERYAEEHPDEVPAPAPPVPLMGDLHPSEVTRTSLLSLDEDDLPRSASEEMAPGSSSHEEDAAESLQRTLGTSHANVSHGDLKALPRGQKAEYADGYETDEYGRKMPVSEYHGRGYVDDEHEKPYSEPSIYPDDEGYEDEYYSRQDVPPPLKYVPYQAGARGLSPIPSVSGYTEGGSEAQHPTHSQSIDSINEAYEKSLERGAPHAGSTLSRESTPGNARGRDVDDHGHGHGHDHVPAAEAYSFQDSATGYRDAMYTDESELPNQSSLAQSSVASHAVRGVGAAGNANVVHPRQAVESNVASLVDGSVLDPSLLTSASGRNNASQPGSDASYQARGSRGASPEKYSAPRRSAPGEKQSALSAASQDQDQDQDQDEDRTRHLPEYELDEQGRKVVSSRSRYRQSPTASEAAITAGAVGAAAAALKAAQERRRAGTAGDDDDGREDGGRQNWAPVGVERNKSFRQRTMDGYEPRSTPAHSVDRFSYEETPKLGASGIPDLDDPLPEIGYVDDAMTEPSVVQHRLDGGHDDDDGDYGQDHRDWSGMQTPTQRSLAAHERELAGDGSSGGGRGLGIEPGQDQDQDQDQDGWHRTSDDRKRDTLLTNPYEDASPVANPTLGDDLLGARGLDGSYAEGYRTGSPGGAVAQKYDEGYISNGPNAQSPAIAPERKAILDFSAAPPTMDVDDPFYVSRRDGADDKRQVSGMSHGMGSPFYDASTGNGIDRIENKDIVALMQHLMVRDAQRSARDTEIVALLMNAALEMRNSFREMKELIQDTGDDVIFSGTENTERLQKAISGPRPYPGATASRSIQSSQQVTLDDASSKKKNLWKRALAGLSTKGTNDLGRIEDMLMQLLGEVDVLKTQTAHPDSGVPTQSSELLQMHGQAEQDRGYEPEGVSTVSHASQSDRLSSVVGPSRSQGLRSTAGGGGGGGGDRSLADNRVSTVQEHEDEHRYDREPASPASERGEHGDAVMSGAGNSSEARSQRGVSVPPDSPSQLASPLASPTQQQHQTLSAGNTPRTDKARKHKSSSSSGWIPKISRWSETTASSVGKAFRSKNRESKDGDQQVPPSRSSSSIGSYDQAYDHNPYYDGDDRMNAGLADPNMAALAHGQARGVSPTQEKPKYRAHRNSLNLQHPQPRPGQTERFRTALETSAQEYNDPATPRSVDWAGSSTSLQGLQTSTNRYSNASSGAGHDAEYTAATSPQGPPRPPKEPIEGGSVSGNFTGRTPPRARISRLAKGSPLSSQMYSDVGGGVGYDGPSSSPGPGPASPMSGSSSPRPENRNLNAALGVPTRRPTGPRAMTPKSAEDEAAREERKRKRDTFGTVASNETDTF
ncbi:hypothetical protein GMORB2_5993 [Geosmithia morbida]|uniref:Uncharacterized protein n=1 Tax=Geosmithia morbida TaxID=1094350 RepID=A0A9P5D2V6_9HYPO|nr:uncharacterized protein GMORB2_5993 [Geosmithia morbida]KAF4124277.1 hypothetical protein GMORB2_5993 [Geosmithia morbida]